PTLEREWTAPLPVWGTVKAVAMGSASEGPLLLQWAVANDLDDAMINFLDAATLKVLPLGVGDDTRSGHGAARDEMHFRASADGQVFGVWCTSHIPQGLGALALRDKSVKAYDDHDEAGHVTPGPDGATLYTDIGLFVTAKVARGVC